MREVNESVIRAVDSAATSKRDALTSANRASLAATPSVSRTTRGVSNVTGEERTSESTLIVAFVASVASAPVKT